MTNFEIRDLVRHTENLSSTRVEYQKKTILLSRTVTETIGKGLRIRNLTMSDIVKLFSTRFERQMVISIIKKYQSSDRFMSFEDGLIRFTSFDLRISKRKLSKLLEKIENSDYEFLIKKIIQNKNDN